MPLIAALVVSFGVADSDAWRYSMVIAGLVCFLMGLVYYFFTQDTPEGNFKELRASGEFVSTKKDKVGFSTVIKDYRTWVLFVVYAACFGIELTVYGTMDDYLQNTFKLERVTAGNIVLSFALMNIFARTLGGYFGDMFGKLKGLRGRVLFLAFILSLEGVMLITFSTTTSIIVGFIFLILFSLSVQMAEGATFSVVPFVNKKAIGSVSGIVGAGGNVGAFLAAILLKSKSAVAEKAAIISSQGLDESLARTAQASAASEAVSSGYFLIGLMVVLAGVLALTIRFGKHEETIAPQEIDGLTPELIPVKAK